MLLISLALLAGCKQEAPVDNSYTPPGYGASVGYLTDTVWKNDSDTIRFGAEGKVTTVPDSWKKDELPEVYLMEYGDFTYSDGEIFAKVKKLDVLSKEFAEYFDEDSVGTTSKSATFTVPRTESISIPDQYGYTRKETIKKYYEMEVKIEGATTSSTFDMENKPTSGDKFVGTYYDGLGRKSIQINKDGTFVRFEDGEQSIQYWEYKTDGTIYVHVPSNKSSGGSTYYLYPHALMSNGYAVAWK